MQNKNLTFSYFRSLVGNQMQRFTMHSYGIGLSEFMPADVINCIGLQLSLKPIGPYSVKMQ